MERLNPKIDPECFKLKTQRVKTLLSAGMSTEAFALLIRPGDPYVLIGDTVYALSEMEFYALRAVEPMNIQAERLFQYFLDTRKTLKLSEEDAKRVDAIEAEVPTCPSCTYMRYRKEICAMAHRYGIMHAPQDKNEVLADHAEYPEVEEPVIPKVFDLLPHMYTVPPETRKSCIDCVEKHLSQAYVLSLEYLQGYPEYVSLVVGHLGEALDEMPSALSPVSDTLQFMLARTNYTKRPFVPLFAVLPLLRAAREKNNTSMTQHPQDNPGIFADNFDIDITQQMKQELAKVDDVTALLVVDYCDSADNFIHGVENLKLPWEGYMALTADTLAPAAPLTANMIRNRRLMFIADPKSMPSEYMLKDVKQSLIDKNV